MRNIRVLRKKRERKEVESKIFGTPGVSPVTEPERYGHRAVAFRGRSALGGKKPACEDRFYSVKRRNSAKPVGGERS
jgi:hypothetical protein